MELTTRSMSELLVCESTREHAVTLNEVEPLVLGNPKDQHRRADL